jgi:23S rRNA pseudouridine1911/1915/1917 synthase
MGMERRELRITARESGRTIRSLLKGELHFSSHAISRLSRAETGILLNGSRAFTNAVVQEGDLLSVETGDLRPVRTPIRPGNWPLPVLWEDGHLLIVDKPAGMTVHASNFLPDTPTVAGALAYTRGPDFLFHPVSRLDKGTTGVMAIAKSGYIHNLLRKALHTNDYHREYRAICLGCPEPEAGRIDLPIGRDPNSTVARMVRPDGAPAVTHYQVLESRGGFSLLRLIPETGRTHQLRVHMAALGHPLAGDWLYGQEDPALIARPALHSYRLCLTHPVTGEELKFTAPLPEDMRKITDFQSL